MRPHGPQFPAVVAMGLLCTQAAAKSRGAERYAAKHNSRHHNARKETSGVELHTMTVVAQLVEISNRCTVSCVSMKWLARAPRDEVAHAFGCSRRYSLGPFLIWTRSDNGRSVSVQCWHRPAGTEHANPRQRVWLDSARTSIAFDAIETQ